MRPTVEQIREVRSRTGLGILEVSNAFKDVENFENIYDVLERRGVLIAEGKQKRDAGVSRLHSYVHNGKLGALVEFRCETDFVAKSEVYEQFMHDICLHVAANPLPYVGEDQRLSYEPLNSPDDAFYSQPFVKDITKTIADVVSEISAKTGEKIEIGVVSRRVAI